MRARVAPPRAPWPAAAAVPAARPAPRALLVEDERVVGDLLAELLALEGYAVDRAMNGRDALELMRRRAYTVIVSDVRMPDVDGAALYHEVRATHPELARRIVFITGDILRPETRRFLAETCVRYLVKPFSIGEFQTALRGVLAAAAPPRPPARDPAGPASPT